MRVSRRFSPTFDSMPIRITPSDVLNPLAPFVTPYGPSDPSDPSDPPSDPMAPVVTPYAPTSPLAYADT